MRTIAGVLLTCAVVTVLFVMKNGVPVWGAPHPKDVASITVTWAEGGEQTCTDPEKIGLAVKLINSLSFQPFTPPPESSVQAGPDVTITYTLQDGQELSAGANWITGWWKGEPRALKEPDRFVRLAEGIFPQK